MKKKSIFCKSIMKNCLCWGGVSVLLALILWPRPGNCADKIIEIVRELEESLVEIPAGEFVMGTDRGERNERPAHKVYLDVYSISRYEISRRQYRAFLESSTHPKPFFWKDWRWGGDNYPVIGISWKDATAFCQWLSKINGWTWRLPTEAEWEKAASWVEKDKLKLMYPWGDKFDRSRVNILGDEDLYERAAPVDSFKEGISPYGIYHLADNVSEWCLDWFENDYYTQSPSKNPQGPAKGILKSVRGGEWKSTKLQVHNTYRKGDWPDSQYNYNGFRVVRTGEK